jgi:SLT domain-containing protein
MVVLVSRHRLDVSHAAVPRKARNSHRSHYKGRATKGGSVNLQEYSSLWLIMNKKSRESVVHPNGSDKFRQKKVPLCVKKNKDADEMFSSQSASTAVLKVEPDCY